jgi:hypothetical protein
VRELPENVAAAILAPVRWSESSGPPPEPRDWLPERHAARRRWTSFARRQPSIRPRVALIADRSAVDAYRAGWDVVLVRPEDWATVLASELPEVLLVDSPVAGNDGAWSYRIAWTAHPDFFLQRDLAALSRWCAARGVLTVFRARESGTASVARWQDAARHLDLIVPADGASAEGYEAIEDRRGNVAPVPPPDLEDLALLGWLRATAEEPGAEAPSARAAA